MNAICMIRWGENGSSGCRPVICFSFRSKAWRRPTDEQPWSAMKHFSTLVFVSIRLSLNEKTFRVKKKRRSDTRSLVKHVKPYFNAIISAVFFFLPLSPPYFVSCSFFFLRPSHTNNLTINRSPVKFRARGHGMLGRPKQYQRLVLCKDQSLRKAGGGAAGGDG